MNEAANVVIRSRFYEREISDRDRYFDKPILTLMDNDPDWFARVRSNDKRYVGPFCYVPWVVDIPF